MEPGNASQSLQGGIHENEKIIISETLEGVPEYNKTFPSFVGYSMCDETVASEVEGYRTSQQFLHLIQVLLTRGHVLMLEKISGYKPPNFSYLRITFPRKVNPQE